MSIGSEWKKSLAQGQKSDVERMAEDARKIIDGLPARIEVARAKGEKSVDALGRPLNFSDVGSCVDDVDELVAMVGKRVLISGYLSSAALIVFNWCEQNDLECVIEIGNRVPGSGFDYNMMARPK